MTIKKLKSGFVFFFKKVRFLCTVLVNHWKPLCKLSGLYLLHGSQTAGWLPSQLGLIQDTMGGAGVTTVVMTRQLLPRRAGGLSYAVLLQ